MLGASWAIYVTIEHDHLKQPSTGAGFVTFLCAAHMLGRMAYTHIFISSWLIVTWYSMLAFHYRWTEEDWPLVAAQVAYVVLANAALCYGDRMFDISRRKAFVVQRRTVERMFEYRDQAKEAQEENQELRVEMFEMILQQHDLNGAGDESLDMRSPVENAMAILRDLVGSDNATTMPRELYEKLPDRCAPAR